MRKQYEGETHNKIYEALQTEYLETRDSKTLGKMYEIAMKAAHNYIAKYCRNRGLRLDLEELSHNSAIFVIEQYLKKPQFKVGKISSYIYFGVIKSLYKDKNIEQLEISYEQYFEEKER
jgi:hypothetical protein